MAIISLSFIIIVILWSVYNENRSMKFMPEMCISLKSNRLDYSRNLWCMFAVAFAFVHFIYALCIYMYLRISMCIIFMKPRSTNTLLHIWISMKTDRMWKNTKKVSNLYITFHSMYSSVTITVQKSQMNEWKKVKNTLDLVSLRAKTKNCLLFSIAGRKMNSHTYTPGIMYKCFVCYVCHLGWDCIFFWSHTCSFVESDFLALFHFTSLYTNPSLLLLSNIYGCMHIINLPLHQCIIHSVSIMHVLQTIHFRI